MDSEASSSYYSVERALAVRRGEHVSHNKHVVVEYKCLCSPQGMDEYLRLWEGFPQEDATWTPYVTDAVIQ